MWCMLSANASRSTYPTCSALLNIHPLWSSHENSAQICSTLKNFYHCNSIQNQKMFCSSWLVSHPLRTGPGPEVNLNEWYFFHSSKCPPSLQPSFHNMHWAWLSDRCWRYNSGKKIPTKCLPSGNLYFYRENYTRHYRIIRKKTRRRSDMDIEYELNWF